MKSEAEIRRDEREKVIRLIDRWKRRQKLTVGDMVDRMSKDFTRASANEIIALIRKMKP